MEKPFVRPTRQGILQKIKEFCLSPVDDLGSVPWPSGASE